MGAVVAFKRHTFRGAARLDTALALSSHYTSCESRATYDRKATNGRATTDTGIRWVCFRGKRKSGGNTQRSPIGKLRSAPVVGSCCVSCRIFFVSQHSEYTAQNFWGSIPCNPG